MVRLRPHHLLCMLTYVGRGYSPAFVSNFDRLAARIDAGEAVEIVSGPDDICAPLLCEADCHCGEARVDRRDEIAAALVELVLGGTVSSGRRFDMTPERTARLRCAFFDGTLRGACDGCQWFDFCTRIADSGYEGVRISPSDVPRAACS